MKKLILSTSLLAMVSTPVADACSTFFLPDGDVGYVAKSYDWKYEHGYLLTNKRNVKKTAFLISSKSTAMNWTSKYGSMTFNQYGREFPLGGINEKGLVVEVMTLKDTEYPIPRKSKSLNELQWIQYGLDNFGSVDEMIRGVSGIAVEAVRAKVHYLACDRSKNCASFEFLNRKLKINKLSVNDLQVLTNSTYTKSKTYSTQFENLGGQKPIPSGTKSLERFVKSAASIVHYQKSFVPRKQNPTPYMFEMLRDVKIGTYSKWNLIYSLNSRDIYFRLARDIKNWKISYNNVNFSCKSKVKMLSVEGRYKGDVTNKFRDYTLAKNRDMVERSIGNEKNVPSSLVEKIIAYPSTTKCME